MTATASLQNGSLSFTTNGTTPAVGISISSNTISCTGVNASTNVALTGINQLGIIGDADMLALTSNLVTLNTPLSIPSAHNLRFGNGGELTLTHNGTNALMTSSLGNIAVRNTHVTGKVTVQLGTNTNATSFEVLNNTGTTIFSVEGDGTVTPSGGGGASFSDDRKAGIGNETLSTQVNNVQTSPGVVDTSTGRFSTKLFPTSFSLTSDAPLITNLGRGVLIEVFGKLYYLGGQISGTGDVLTIYQSSIDDPLTWTLVSGKTTPSSVTDAIHYKAADGIYIYGGTSAILKASYEDPTTWSNVGTFPGGITLNNASIVNTGSAVYFVGGLNTSGGVVDNKLYTIDQTDPKTLTEISGGMVNSSAQTVGIAFSTPFIIGNDVYYPPGRIRIAGGGNNTDRVMYKSTLDNMALVDATSIVVDTTGYPTSNNTATPIIRGDWVYLVTSTTLIAYANINNLEEWTNLERALPGFAIFNQVLAIRDQIYIFGESTGKVISSHVPGIVASPAATLAAETGMSITEAENVIRGIYTEDSGYYVKDPLPVGIGEDYTSYTTTSGAFKANGGSNVSSTGGSLTFVFGNTIYLFGGGNTTNHSDRDIWSASITDLTNWTITPGEDNLPGGRYTSSARIYTDNGVRIFGSENYTNAILEIPKVDTLAVASGQLGTTGVGGDLGGRAVITVPGQTMNVGRAFPSVGGYNNGGSRELIIIGGIYSSGGIKLTPVIERVDTSTGNIIGTLNINTGASDIHGFARGSIILIGTTCYIFAGSSGNGNDSEGSSTRVYKYDISDPTVITNTNQGLPNGADRDRVKAFLFDDFIYFMSNGDVPYRIPVATFLSNAGGGSLTNAGWATFGSFPSGYGFEGDAIAIGTELAFTGGHGGNSSEIRTSNNGGDTPQVPLTVSGGAAYPTTGDPPLKIGDTGTIMAAVPAPINSIGVGRKIFESANGGDNNLGVGYNIGRAITTAIGNVGVGTSAIGSEATEGVFNELTTGNYNTAIGWRAGEGVDTGTHNTALGAESWITTGSYSRSTAVGYLSQPTADDQLRLGNASTTVLLGNDVAVTSDARDKTEIGHCTMGLDFINMLTPRKYKWDKRQSYVEKEFLETGRKVTIMNITKDGSLKGTRYHYGFIAQEVKATLDSIGVDNGIYVDNKTNGGLDELSLRYTEFIAPMVKAIQELSERVITLEGKVASLMKS